MPQFLQSSKFRRPCQLALAYMCTTYRYHATQNLMIKALAHEATDPLQAEAMAMQLANVIHHGHCAYLTDCQLLVDTSTIAKTSPLETQTFGC